MKKKILITGGSGRFGSYLKNIKTNFKVLFPSKKIFNILNIKQMIEYLKKNKVTTVIHLAGLSRPMKIHNTDIERSINLNIIGSANITNACSNLKIKLIYFSTNYVYPGNKGNYLENDALLPVNKYAWSKLGGECAVRLYNNSLILRVCMTEKPFVHKKAFGNVKSSFMYHEDVAKILFKLINKKGIINIGGQAKSIYNFAKKDNPNVKRVFLKKNNNIGVPFNSSINTRKLQKIINNK